MTRSRLTVMVHHDPMATVPVGVPASVFPVTVAVNVTADSSP